MGSVVASGGKFAYPDDAEETPDTLQAIYEFDDFSMIWEHAAGIGLGPFQRAHGVAFVGNEGTLVVDRGRWEVFAETGTEAGKPYYKMDPVPEHRAQAGEGGLDQHTANFIECMQTRAQPRCHAATGSLAAVNAHLTFRSGRTGRFTETRRRAGSATTRRPTGCSRRGTAARGSCRACNVGRCAGRRRRT